MLWWRKRNEGFEWRDYVRTTILVRREQRRQRLKDAKEAAAAHVKDAGRRGLDAGIAGAHSAGTGLGWGLKGVWSALKAIAAAAGRGALRGGATVASGSVLVAGGLWRAMAALARRAGGPLVPVLDPLLARMREPRPNLVAKIVTVLAGLGAFYRTWAFGFDGDAVFAAVLCVVSGGLVLLAATADPRRGRRSSERESLLARLRDHEFVLPGERRFSGGRVGLAGLGLAAAAAAGAAFYQYGSPISLAGLIPAPVTTGALPDTADPSRLEGRATAVSGDALRIAGRNLRLDGIEAPEATQSCRRSNGRTWRCGTAAREALADLLRGRRVACEILGEDSARCYVGGDDIAQALVRKGHVFADGGFWGAYAGVEDEARAQKVGLWGGEAERPQDYRDKRWEEAKRTAPDGCPIKGPIRSGTRTYVLPWALRYDSIRLRTSRGERWFCSESEAEAAGWTSGSRS